MPALADVIDLLQQAYPPSWAASWDAVGLVCGRPDAHVNRVLFAVDPVPAVARQAVATGADLLITHHPLYLRGTSTVAADTPKGLVLHDLIEHGIALHVAHTNADAAPDIGVSDALAAALGLQVLGPLAPDPSDQAGRRGTGRVCELPTPEPLSAFLRRAAAALPATAPGLRATGDPATEIRRVAVCGGAGDSLLAAARTAGVDAYLTADLRHHPASEATEAGPPALIDATHFATEHPWTHTAARHLASAAAERGWTTTDGGGFTVAVSTLVTDPWTAHAAPTPGPAAPAEAVVAVPAPAGDPEQGEPS